MHNVINTGRRIKFFFGHLIYLFIRWMGRFINDLSSQDDLSQKKDLFRSIKDQRIRALGNGHRIFAWSLHDNDNRRGAFQVYDEGSWKRWLEMYQFRHFVFCHRDTVELNEIKARILYYGSLTWKRVFKRYIVPELQWHDLYSVPDVFFIKAHLGRIPESVLDIGAGWGRMGLAWRAIGVKNIYVSDAIEQPYLIQNQYLSAIPDVDLIECLERWITTQEKILKDGIKIFHVPLWDLPRLPDDMFDAISAIQVFREVGDDFFQFVLPQINRLLKKDGILYTRENDHQYRTACEHHVDLENELRGMGFQIHNFNLEQGCDIHGVPRIYAKT